MDVHQEVCCGFECIDGRASGRIPTQLVWHQQLRKWLIKSGKDWSHSDSEAAAYGCRQMLQTCLKRKQDHGGQAPRRSQSLDSLLAKLHVDHTKPPGTACEPSSSDSDVDLSLAYPRRVVAPPMFELSSAPSSDCEIIGCKSAPSTTVASLEDLEQNLFGPDDKPEVPVTPGKRVRLRKKTFDLTPSEDMLDS